MSEATQAIAGAITGGILEEAVQGGYAVNDEAAKAVQENQAQEQPETPQEAPQEPVDPVDEIVDSLTTELAEKTEEVEPEPPDPEDESELPDFEAEVDKELLDEEIASSGEDAYEDPAAEWAEPYDRDAERRARIAEKKAAHFEKISAQRNLKAWEKEADKFYPLWRARGEITATSKRGFLKAAKEANDAVKPFVKAAVKTREEQLEAERQTMKQEVKAEAQEAWGKPTQGVQAPVGQTEYDEAQKGYQEARKNQDLAQMLHFKRIITSLGGGEE